MQTVSQSISFSDHISRLTDQVLSPKNPRITDTLENLNAHLGRNENDRKSLLSDFLPSLLHKVEDALAKPFEGSETRNARSISARWRAIQPCREAFGQVVSFSLHASDRFNIPIDADVMARCHIVLLSGPARLHRPLWRPLKLLEGQMTFSSEFVAEDFRRITSIAESLKKAGLAEIVGGRNPKTAVSALQIADIVMDAYRLPRLPVRTLPPEQDHLIGFFSSTNREVRLGSKSINELSETRPEFQAFVILHELRHAIAVTLYDNLNYFRRDGTQTHYTHRGPFEDVVKFRGDIQKMLLSYHAREVKPEILSPFSSHRQISAAYYAAQFSERDADAFAAAILSGLMGKEAHALIEAYNDSVKTLSGSKAQNSVEEAEKNNSSFTVPAALDQTASLGGVVLPGSEKSLLSVPKDGLAGELRRIAGERIRKNDDPYEKAVREAKKDAKSKTGRPEAADNPRHDPYEGMPNSLSFLAASILGSSDRAMRAGLPLLHSKLDEPFPGHFGMTSLHNSLEKVLERADLAEPLRGELARLYVRVSGMLEGINVTSRLKELSPDEVKQKVIGILALNGKAQVRTTREGRQLTLDDAGSDFSVAVERKDVLGCAMLLHDIHSIIRGGFYGEWPGKRLLKTFAEAESGILAFDQPDVQQLILGRVAGIKETVSRWIARSVAARPGAHPVLPGS